MKFVRDDENGEYKTNQQHVGMKDLFRGYVVKYWKGVELNTNKHHELNKMVVKKCVECYVGCWKERNIEHNDEKKQRKRVIKWHKNTLEKVKKQTNLN